MEIIRHQPSRESRNTWRKMHWKSRLQKKLWQMPTSSQASNQGQRSPPILGLFMNLPTTAGAAWALQPLLSSSHFFQEQCYAGLIVLHWRQEDASKAKSYATLWRVVQLIPAGLRSVCRSSKMALSPLGTVGYTHQHWDKLPRLHLHPAFAFWLPHGLHDHHRPLLGPDLTALCKEACLSQGCSFGHFLVGWCYPASLSPPKGRDLPTSFSLALAMKPL